MKLVINGKKYDLEESIQKVTLQNLYVLKVSHGVGMKSIMETFQRFEDEKDPLGFLDDADAMLGFQAMIWLVRRHAGEQLTLEEANDIPLDQLLFEDDEEPAGGGAPGEAQPAPTASAPGDAAEPPEAGP